MLADPDRTAGSGMGDREERRRGRGRVRDGAGKDRSGSARNRDTAGQDARRPACESSSGLVVSGRRPHSGKRPGFGVAIAQRYHRGGADADLVERI